MEIKIEIYLALVSLSALLVGDFSPGTMKRHDGQQKLQKVPVIQTVYVGEL